MSHDRPAWTPPLDAQLRRLRLDGASWAEIGLALSVSPDIARERGRRLGARRPADAGGAPPAEDMRRPPLPAGHPRSWRLLTEGTALAGTSWPGWV